MRQEAYYNAVPHKGKISRAEQISQANLKNSEAVNDEEEVSTIALQEVPMPELPVGYEYMIEMLHSAGTASATGMGLVGLSWTELASWQELTNRTGTISAADLETLHVLSRVYASEYANASQEGAKPPYEPPLEIEVLEQAREFISDKLEDVFAGLLRNQDLNRVD